MDMSWEEVSIVQLYLAIIMLVIAADVRCGRVIQYYDDTQGVKYPH